MVNFQMNKCDNYISKVAEFFFFFKMQSLTINYSSKQIIGKCMQLDSTTTKGKNPIYVFFFCM